MTEADADLIAARLLDGTGGARRLDWAGVDRWRPEHGVLWVHLDRGEHATRWLHERSGLAPLVVDALVAQDTRPRTFSHGTGLVVLLRGVNLNPNADPDDMVSIRVWIEAGRIVTVRLRRLMAAQDILDALERGCGPEGPGRFLAALSANLVARMGPIIHELEERLDEIEEAVITDFQIRQRSELSQTRRQAIVLRRYLAPQRDAMNRLVAEPPAFVDPDMRARLREAADAVQRYVEDLDAVRERAAVTQDEVSGRISEQAERTTYKLTIVATVFLPLGFVTGLLGVNVGGIPGTDSPWAFAILCLLIGGLTAVEVWLLRRVGWL